jgi:hypothetical protein
LFLPTFPLYALIAERNNRRREDRTKFKWSVPATVFKTMADRDQHGH